MTKQPLSPKQRAKRRWKAQRDERAKTTREAKAYRFKRVAKIKTPFGTVEIIRHPLFRDFGLGL